MTDNGDKWERSRALMSSSHREAVFDTRPPAAGFLRWLLLPLALLVYPGFRVALKEVCGE